MKVLITGSRGFIGSRLADYLEKKGNEIIHFDLQDGKYLLDLEMVEKDVSQADVVFHLAAQADLTKMENIEGARDGVDVNVQGTHNITYACALYKKWLIHASTVCVYGNLDTHPANEDTSLPNPSELYACSKYAAEWIIKGYGKNFKMPWTILRFATIYGEGMRPAMGMHIFFRQAMANKDITIHGQGTQDRTLTYVDDLVKGIGSVIDYPVRAQNQVINLTSDLSVSAFKMAMDIKALTNSASRIVFIKQRPNQTYHEDFSTDKAYKSLNWYAETQFEDGLKKTYEWIKNQ